MQNMGTPCAAPHAGSPTRSHSTLRAARHREELFARAEAEPLDGMDWLRVQPLMNVSRILVDRFSNVSATATAVDIKDLCHIACGLLSNCPNEELRQYALTKVLHAFVVMGGKAEAADHVHDIASAMLSIVEPGSVVVEDNAFARVHVARAAPPTAPPTAFATEEIIKMLVELSSLATTQLAGQSLLEVLCAIIKSCSIDVLDGFATDLINTLLGTLYRFALGKSAFLVEAVCEIGQKCGVHVVSRMSSHFARIAANAVFYNDAAKICRLISGVCKKADSDVKRVLATEMMRKSLIQLSESRNLKKNSVVMAMITKVLCRLMTDSSRGVVNTFATKELRNLWVAVATGAPTKVAAKHAAQILCCVAQQGDEGTLEHFAVPQVRVALTRLAEVAKDQRSASAVLEALCAMTSRAPYVFATVDVGNALIHIIPHTTQGPHQVSLVANAFHTMLDADVLPDVAMCETLSRLACKASDSTIACVCTAVFTALKSGGRFAELQLATDDLLQELVRMSGRALTDGDVQAIASVLCVTSKAALGDQRSLPEALMKSIRDAILAMAPRASSNETISWMSLCISNVASGNDTHTQVLFHTEDVRDVLATLADRAGNAQTARWVGVAICRIAQKRDVVQSRLLQTHRMSAALKRLATLATTSESAQYVSNALINIANKATREFTMELSDSLLETFTGMCAAATTSTSVDAVSNALSCLLRRLSFKEDAGQVASRHVHDAVVAMSKYATTAKAVEWLMNVMVNLAVVPLCSPPLCDAVTQFAGVLASTPTNGGIVAWATGMSRLICYSGADDFNLPRLRDGIAAIAVRVKSSPAATSVVNVLYCIVKRSETAAAIFATVDFVKSVEAICAYVKGDIAASEVGRTLELLGNVATFPPSRATTLDALAMLSREVRTPEAASNVTRAFIPRLRQDVAASLNGTGVHNALEVLREHVLTQERRRIDELLQDYRTSIVSSLSTLFRTTFQLPLVAVDIEQCLASANGSDVVMSHNVCMTDHLWPFLVERMRGRALPNSSTFLERYDVVRAQVVGRTLDAFLATHAQEAACHLHQAEAEVDRYTSDDQRDALAALGRCFEDRVGADGRPEPGARIVLAWHGVRSCDVESVCRNGLREYRKRDSGFFGAGNYFSLEAANAARYAASDGEGGQSVIMLFAVSVSQVYPVTLAADYRAADAAILEQHAPDPAALLRTGFSNFYSTDRNAAVALAPHCDAHFVPVKECGYVHPLCTQYRLPHNVDHQAAPASEATAHELVVSSHIRSIPIAVINFKKKPTV